MKRPSILVVSLLAVVSLSGPSAAQLPCAKTSSDGTELTCFCQPGATPGSERCKCVQIAVDESGVVVY
jgi:hypothetical protein